MSSRGDLLWLDGIGYVQLDARDADLLFQALTGAGVEGLGGHGLPCAVLRVAEGDPRPGLVAAIVDRTDFSASIIETGTESVRQCSTRANQASRTKA
jgi:hypothetical protein